MEGPFELTAAEEDFLDFLLSPDLTDFDSSEVFLEDFLEAVESLFEALDDFTTVDDFFEAEESVFEALEDFTWVEDFLLADLLDL